MTDLKFLIENAYHQKEIITSENVSPTIQQAVQKTIDLLDKGEIRIAEKRHAQWVVHKWIKMAILLYFKIKPCKLFDAGYTSFYDKIPLKYVNNSTDLFQTDGVRIAPHAIIRKGAYLAANTVLMSSYVNIGAYIDSGTLIDTWATIGSGAQIGKNVHISGGVGIGGVLEPLQEQPTIIEDNCFIGARSEIVEGVVVEKDVVISMGVFIGQSTPIYNSQTQEITYGRIPAGSVVISGSIPSKNGHYNRYSAIIIKKVDEKTQRKISLNKLLRER